MAEYCSSRFKPSATLKDRQTNKKSSLDPSPRLITHIDTLESVHQNESVQVSFRPISQSDNAASSFRQIENPPTENTVTNKSTGGYNPNSVAAKQSGLAGSLHSSMMRLDEYGYNGHASRLNSLPDVKDQAKFSTGIV